MKDYSEDERAIDLINEDTLNGVNLNGVWRLWCSQIGREKETVGVSISGTRNQWRKELGISKEEIREFPDSQVSRGLPWWLSW